MTEERKRILRSHFARAASTYDAYADVQRELAGLLAAQLTEEIRPQHVLELGCGTGNYTLALAERFPCAVIHAIDFAEGMLSAAREKMAAQGVSADFICTDAERFLACAGQEYDVITSNAALQWFDELEAAVQNVRRILAEDGLFWASIYGPQTLYQLDAGLQAVFRGEKHVQASNFYALSDLQDILSRHFWKVDVHSRIFERQYRTLMELLNHIRLTGTSGWRGSESPLLTRRTISEMEKWFLDEYAGFPATYEVFFLRCRP